MITRTFFSHSRSKQFCNKIPFIKLNNFYLRLQYRICKILVHNIVINISFKIFLLFFTGVPITRPRTKVKLCRISRDKSALKSHSVREKRVGEEIKHPEVTQSYPKSYPKLPKVTQSYPKLPKVTQRYPKLPEVTRSYLELPVATN